ncbi:MAG TPA: hypothetical protein VG826_05285 [Pirellulales bacterium]|nr:hypothetical protein [Pirellulales bacterium]
MKDLDDILTTHDIDDTGREAFRIMVREGRIADAEFRRRLQVDPAYRACLDAIVNRLTGRAA